MSDTERDSARSTLITEHKPLIHAIARRVRSEMGSQVPEDDLLAFGVQERRPAPGTARGNPIRRERLRELGRGYWSVVALGGVFTLARFSEAFLVLKAEQSGIALALVPLLMVAMNAVYALSAYPLGRLSDRVSHRRLLAAGLALLVAADLVLAQSEGWRGVLAGVMLWGLHMGMTQGLLAAMVAGQAPAELRGTAFGLFNLVCGLAMLLASSLAGLLWDRFGSAHTFYAGAAFAALALLLLGVGWALRRRAIGPASGATGGPAAP